MTPDILKFAAGGIGGTEAQALAMRGTAPVAAPDLNTNVWVGEPDPMPARTRKTTPSTAPEFDEGRDYLEVTRAFWQARTDRPLSREDAREMAHNLLGFFTVLREWTLEERRRSARLASDEAESAPSSQAAMHQHTPSSGDNPV